MTGNLIDRRRLIGMGVGSLLVGSGISSAQPLTGSVVETANGKIQGLRGDGVHLFKGVYYAGSPKRFMPPPPVAPWAGVKHATEWGPSAPQGGAGARATLAESDEHCQVLNIWTPGFDGARRPVLVWLHGGGFQYGSASSGRYDGANLARDRDVVVVSINHRLGPLGSMLLSDINPDFAASGAVGMLDAIAALQWIKDNIDRFGGDPGRVMIFGQSGGGGKVLTLMAMPRGSGLFHSGICESGSMKQTVATPEDGLRQRALLLSEMGLGERDAIRLVDMPLATIVAAQAKLNASIPRHPVHPALPFADGLRPFSPILDGRFIPEQPFQERAPAASLDVPLMIGSNSKELRIFSKDRPDLFALDWADLPKLLEPELGGRTGEAIRTYRDARPGLTPSNAYWAITADQFYWVNSLHVASVKSAANAAPAFMYHFAYDPTDSDANAPSSVYAAHGAELPFIFRHMPGGATTVELKLQDMLSSAWSSFARTGMPGAPDLPAWNAYDSERRTTMIFDSHPHVALDPRSSERQWWQSSAQA